MSNQKVNWGVFWHRKGKKDDKTSSFKCDYCGRSFTSVKGLQVHTTLKHPGKPRKIREKMTTKSKQTVKIPVVEKPAEPVSRNFKKSRRGISKQVLLDRTVEFDACTPSERSKVYPKQVKIGRSMLYKGRKNLDDLGKLTHAELKKRRLPKNETFKQTGLFPKMQQKVLVKYRLRRAVGKRCPRKWFQSHMRNYCKMYQPVHVFQNGKTVKYDPEKHKFGDQWANTFFKRHKISSQRATNKKPKSIFERLHKVKNYHYYSIYLCALEPPGTVGDRAEEHSHAKGKLTVEEVDKYCSQNFYRADDTSDDELPEGDTDGWD